MLSVGSSASGRGWPGSPGYSTLAFVVGGVVAVALGWLLPAFVVTVFIRRRARRSSTSCPEMIDLLVVALEAGVSLAARCASRRRRSRARSERR